MSVLSFGWLRIRIVSGINKTANVRMYEALSRNYFCHGKAISIKYSECGSVALVIQHTMSMRRTILPCVTRLAVPYFTTLCHKRNEFLEKRYWI